MTRVLVCGGRDYEDRARVFGVLNDVENDAHINVLITGGATGADHLAGEWVRARPFSATIRTHLVEVPALWEVFSKAAGPIRNDFMLDFFRPYLVVAFPGGAGTADCVRRAFEHYQIKVMEIPL